MYRNLFKKKRTDIFCIEKLTRTIWSFLDDLSFKSRRNHKKVVQKKNIYSFILFMAQFLDRCLKHIKSSYTIYSDQISFQSSYSNLHLHALLIHTRTQLNILHFSIRPIFALYLHQISAVVQKTYFLVLFKKNLHYIWCKFSIIIK